MTANVSIVIAERINTLRFANSALRARIPDELLPKPAPAASTAEASAGAAAAGRKIHDR